MSRKNELLELTRAALVEEAKALGIASAHSMNKNDLADAIIAAEEPAVRATQQSSSDDDDKVEAILADIRMAWAAGVKIAQVSESDEELQRAVEARLTDDELRRICWGGSSARHVVG